ncbi:MAG: cupin domain-containing protein [Actinomycetota bacterium]
MAATAKSFERPEETTGFANGEEQTVEVRGAAVGLATFRPGWRWSNDIRPLTGASRCPLHHAGYVLAGTLHVEPVDGPAVDLAAGDVFEIEPEHDAWVVGDEACVLLDWGGHVREYTRPVARMAGEQR